jgi:ADP-ribose pyrophosphatase YjhB (NUDIX family)
MHEVTDRGAGKLPEADYLFVCDRVPILCVDILPVISGGNSFGLIERDTPDGTRGLCLVGGRVYLDESLPDALMRHFHGTLGDNVSLELASLNLVGVYQYYKKRRPGQLHDPRKNAVSVTYTGVMRGEAEPKGEAHGFHVFTLDDVPKLEEFGFDQGRVVHDGLATLRRLRAEV